MSHEATEIFKYIIANRDDDCPRLIYADWLEEYGDDDRAEFIRAHVALARLPEDSLQRERLKKRVDELFYQHQKEWEAGLRKLNARTISWERGMPVGVFMLLGDFLSHADELLRLAPISCLKSITWCKEEVRALACSPHLASLTLLDLAATAAGDNGVQVLAESPYSHNLTKLDLRYNNIGPDGARGLANSSHLANLAYLNLANNKIGSPGAKDLARSAHLLNIRDLVLADNDINAAGARALACSPHLTSLTHLDLRSNPLGSDGLRALAASPHFRPDIRISVSDFNGTFAQFQHWEREHRRSNPGSLRGRFTP